MLLSRLLTNSTDRPTSPVPSSLTVMSNFWYCSSPSYGNSSTNAA